MTRRSTPSALSSCGRLRHWRAIEVARVQRSRGDIEAAVRNFEKVIAAEPDWLRPHIELAALYYRLNRPEDGQKERAIVDKMYMQGKKAGRTRIGSRRRQTPQTGAVKRLLTVVI